MVNGKYIVKILTLFENQCLKFRDTFVAPSFWSETLPLRKLRNVSLKNDLDNQFEKVTDIIYGKTGQKSLLSHRSKFDSTSYTQANFFGEFVEMLPTFATRQNPKTH